MNDGSGTLSMGVREYDPSTGQFLSNDPTGLAGGDTNFRSYAGNNPLGFIDPAGLCDNPNPTKPLTIKQLFENWERTSTTEKEGVAGRAG